jgi:uncharacterized repeat protein (TIGR01451 family)
MARKSLHSAPRLLQALLLGVLSPVLALLPGRAVAAGGQDWTVECVDCPKVFATTSEALQIDAAGRPHIAYGGDHLYYAWYDGMSWQKEVVDDSLRVGTGASLALDGAGVAHVAYWDERNRALLYAKRDPSGWRVETIASVASLNGSPSLGLDGQGWPHVAYFDYIGQELRYAYRDALGWHVRVVERMAAYSGADASLALDGQGQAHISYSVTGLLKYAHQDGAGWRVETVPEAGNPLAATSLALDGQGWPHIAYGSGHYGSQDGEARYAYRDAAGWHVETVEQVGDYYVGPSLALDGAGLAHLTYYDGVSQTLKYAWRDSAGWHPEVLANMPYASSASLALDGDGAPHVAHRAGYFMDLYYACRDPGGWHSELVDEGYVMPSENAMALDGSGLPHAVYYGGPDEALRYASRDSAGWHWEAVGNAGTGGLPLSLALDRAGWPHLTYLFVVPSLPLERTLTYAYRDPSGWHAEMVATGPGIDCDTSLALDGEGRPHVALFDHDGGLKHAYRDGAGWHLETVDGTPGAGYWPSLAVDSQGFAHIGYEAAEEYALRHAYQDASGWHVEIVDDSDVVGSSISLALDGNDLVHIGYVTFNSPDYLYVARYAYRDASGWHREAIPGAPQPGCDFSLALTRDGFPAVGYPGYGGHVLYYVHQDAAGWHVETVATSEDSYGHLSLALDGRGDPHMTYFLLEGDLRYARGHLHADLSSSAKVGQRGVEPGERLAYTISLVNSGREPTAFALTDPIPAHTTYAPGSLWASGGAIDAGEGISWTGTITGFEHLTATFAVTVEGALTQPATIANVATLEGDPLGPLALPARNVVNGVRLYLPVVYKSE